MRIECVVLAVVFSATLAGPIQCATICSTKNPLPQLESLDERQTRKPAIPWWLEWLQPKPVNDSNTGLMTPQYSKSDATATDDVIGKRIAIHTLCVVSICAKRERLKNDGSDLRHSATMERSGRDDSRGLG